MLWMVTSALNSDDGELSPENRRDDADSSKSTESSNNNRVLTYDIQMSGVQPAQVSSMLSKTSILYYYLLLLLGLL